MAIKIDNKDLSKRIINGQEVQKAILNGAEIRPNEVPHIDYHVINDFTGGGSGGGSSLPTGWSSSSDELSISSGGISSSTGNTVRVDYDTMPSLMNARRVNIIIEFDWNPGHDINDTQLGVGFPGDGSLGMSELLWIDNYGYDVRCMGSARPAINVTQGEYKWDFNIGLDPFTNDSNNYRGTATLRSGETYKGSSYAGMSNMDEYHVRTAENLALFIGQGVTVKKIDMYIYNDYNIPATWERISDFSNGNKDGWREGNNNVTWGNDGVYSTSGNKARIESNGMPRLMAKRIETIFDVHYVPSLQYGTSMKTGFLPTITGGTIYNYAGGIPESGIAVMIHDSHFYYGDGEDGFPEGDYTFKVIYDLENPDIVGSLWGGLYRNGILINEVDHGVLPSNILTNIRKSNRFNIHLYEGMTLKGLSIKCYN